MPTVYRSRGFRFFFFSNEGREPPHIHVEAAEKLAKFWLEPVSLAYSVKFASVELTQLARLVVEHGDMFKERWNELFGR